MRAIQPAATSRCPSGIERARTWCRAARRAPLLGGALVLGCVLATGATRAQDPSDDPRWGQARDAYADGRSDEGHNLLVTLADDHPGDLDLAAACYQKVLLEEGRLSTKNPWIKLASERLMGLQQLGALSANSSIIRSACDTMVEHLMAEGRYLEVRETIERMRRENPHDLYWRMMQARNYGLMDLAEARPLFEALKEDLDPDHPDPIARDRWNWVQNELKSFDRLPNPILPLPEGSPLHLMEPDDPDGRWRTVLDRSPADIPAEVDRLAGQAFAVEQVVLWQDMSGLTDPHRALDLHLLSKPAPELRALRAEQEDNFTREILPTSPTEADLLGLGRRYAWSRSAQRLLLDLANQTLWEGRTESALRSFQELLLHTTDPGLRDAAQVGQWTALALSGGVEELRATAGTLDPGKTYPWMGKQATGAEIRTSLLSGHQPPTAVTAPSLGAVQQRILHLPPVAPWPTHTPSVGFGVDLQVAGNQIIASGRNMLVCFNAVDPSQQHWAQLQRYPVEEHLKTGYYPGYYRPLIDSDTIITRWGLTSLPTGLAAFDRSSGDPLWASLHDRDPAGPGAQRPLRFAVPAGDPVRADGMLFYLQWGTINDVNDKNGRSVSLVCFDPRLREIRWTAPIAEAGQSSDLVGNLETATPQAALYGNRVTVHRGAVYSSSNAGLVARSDVRDGRIDWIYYYRRTRADLAADNLGCAPLVAGETVIFMPRDAGRIFALDQRTGRLLWDNPMVLATEVLGVHRDLLLVRGVGTLAGLDLATGEARWFRPLPERTLGRSQLIADSIFLGQIDTLRRFDAQTGKLLESRPWNLGEERPLGFTVSGNDLYVISDRPTNDVRQEAGSPLAPDAPAQSAPLTLPLQRTWSLSRSDAHIALPPAGSDLAGTAFLLSGGILECLDLSPRGSIRWRRFIDAHDASLSFAEQKLLLVERGRSRHTPSRAIALNARDGTFLWEAPLPAGLGHSYRFESMLIYHDARSELVAIDLETGRRAWDRKLGESHLMTPFFDGRELHLFHASLWHGPHHLVLDPRTGRTNHRLDILVSQGSKSTAHGRPIENGYYEVRFPPTAARFVRLTTLSDINGRGWASAAEFHVLDENHRRIPRKNWSVEAEHERNAGLRAKPYNLIDDDPSSWWHTQWIGAIPPHPHDVFIDLGARYTLTGFHYLPAKIVNNNGMLRDYEFRVREDRQDWGEPVAKGILVNRLDVQRAGFGPQALFFQARNYPKNEAAVFRYEFGGPAAAVEENAQLLSMHGRYALISAQNKLILRRSDDPDYRFDLSSHLEHGHHGHIIIEGDRLITARQKLVIADLNTRQFLEIPKDDKSARDKDGPVLSMGPDRFLKLVHQNNQQTLVMIDAKSGSVVDGVLPDQLEPFQESRFLRPDGQQFLSFDRTLLFYDNAILSAWMTAP